MEGVDKITLELLMNKQQYNKYLAIKDPSKYDEVQQYLIKIKKYKDIILEITEEYVVNSNKQNTNELDEAFQQYSKSCIRFIEMKNLETDIGSGRDDDVLFEPMHKKDDHDDDVLFKPMHSFWGKGAKKADE
uniref:Uncharacterized protein n=1 Tax=viral metagenome TaxID=1070528 RepID=A0A6C0F423_9ZZZZ